MMKLLRNKKLASWVVGIVGLGLITTYIPLLFVPQQVAPETQEPSAQQPFTPGTSSQAAVTSTVGPETPLRLDTAPSSTGTPTTTPSVPSPLLPR
jgi:hypothetical protein